jgi:Flp pilus assembly protein protease CpaA
MDLIFLVAMVPIVIADLRYHLIPNIYLKILSVALCVTWVIKGMPSFDTFVITLIFAGLLIAMKFGMGDVKLLAILILTFQPEMVVFCGLVIIFSLTHIVILIPKNRKIPVSIPLAPAIFSALTTYLATR